MRARVIPALTVLLLSVAGVAVYFGISSPAALERILEVLPRDSRESLRRGARAIFEPLPQLWGGHAENLPPHPPVPSVDVPPPPAPPVTSPPVIAPTVSVPPTGAPVSPLPGLPPPAAAVHNRPPGPVAPTAPAQITAAQRTAAPPSSAPLGPDGLPQQTSLTALNENVAVSMTRLQVGRTQLALITGGLPVSRHVLWRSSVGQFMKAAGAVAGVNGTFFKDAAIASNDSNMLGPLLTADGTFWQETDAYLLGRIAGRPLVAWSADQFLVTAFHPGQMNSRAQLRALLPGVTDAFLAGAWLVRGGAAVSAADMKKYAPSDAQEVRPRVFFGVTRAGLGIAGATTTPVSSARLAQIAQSVGAQEAVLMDSGYSTSLIYGSQVLAVGHKSRKVPSRPVPHAIVFFNPSSVQANGKPLPGR